MKKLLLTKGFIVKLDNYAYDVLSNYDWSVNYNNYLIYVIRRPSIAHFQYSNNCRLTVNMYRLLTGYPPEKSNVFFLDKDRFNMTHQNLLCRDKDGNELPLYRFTGMSRHKGVIWDKRKGLWKGILGKQAIAYGDNEVGVYEQREKVIKELSKNISKIA